MLTRTDRRRFPVLLAVIAVLALAMPMLFSTVQAQEGSAPDQPTGLEATATHDSVTLTWDDPQDDTITGYVVLRRVRVNDTGGDFDVLVANTETAALTYTDDTVSAETRYTYRIKAINEHGVSERSRWSHINVPAAPEAAEGDEQDGEGDGGGAPGGPGKRANVSEPDGEDLPGDTTTTGKVDVGGSVTGSIGSRTDDDWFAVELKAGTRYQIDLEGVDTGRGTLPDPWLAAITDVNGNIISSSGNQDGGVGKNGRKTFTPTTDSTHYVEAQSNLTASVATGTYTLSVIVLGANGASEADTDFSNTTATTGRVDVGASATGNIETEDDEDWFKVVLEADKTYQIDMKGEYGGGGTLEDPLLDDIRDSSGTGISDTGNDDVDADNDNYDSRTTFTPTTGGAYYLVATTADDSGTYTLSVREIQCTLNEGDIWCGVVTVAEVKSGETLLAHGFADTTSPATLDAGSLAGNPDDRTFPVGDNEYTVQAVNVGTGSARDGKLGFWITDVEWLDVHDEGILVLTIDGVATPRAFDGAQGLLGGLYSWDTDLDWSSTPEVTVRLQTPDDFSAGTTTTGEVDVGGSVTGNIETVADYGDWFKVELEADTRYQIDLEGADTGRGTLVDPGIELLANSIGNTVPNTGGSDSGVGKNDRTIYTPSTSDAYYVVVQPSDTGLGTYTLSVIVLGANGVSEADTDFPSTTATTGRVDVGASATGNISTSGDNDLFRVELEAGKEYQFDLEGAATTRGTLSDPYLGLYDGSVSLIATNDDIDSNTNPNSQIVYTATATGAHYLAASGRGGSMGTYTFSVRDVTPESDDCSHDTTTTCEVEVGGSATGNIESQNDRDWFKVELEAGTRYQIDVEGADTDRGTQASPGAGLYDVSGTSLMVSDNDSGVGNNARVIYAPTAASTYYVQASGLSGPGLGTYTLSVIVLGASGASEADTDCLATTATTCRVEVGASATGNIETATDRDWFKVELEAGKSYQIDLEGEVGGGTLEDPYLRNICDSSGTEISGTENDDIHGGDSDSRVVFTPTAAGAYYLVASGYDSASNTGTYTLSVTKLETRTEEGDTDFAASVATLGRVEVGGSATGDIENVADGDWFRVVLEKDKTYVFDLEGTETNSGTLADPLLTLRDASGSNLEGDDNGGDGANSRLEYTATADGIHYLSATTPTSATSGGTYKLSVREVACTLNEGDHWCGVVTVGPILSGTNTIGHGYTDIIGVNGGSFVGDTDITVGSNTYTFEGIFVASTGVNSGALNFKTTAHFTNDDKAALELHIDVDGASSMWAISDSITTTGVGLILWTTAALDWSEAITVTARLRPLTQGPTVTSVAVTSMPALETDTYGAGETIEVSVTFSEAVNATSGTDFVLSVAGARRAPLLRGSGTATLVFGYTVVSSDEDTNGIWIGDQDRTLVGNRNGEPQNGTITSVATSAAADLTHDELGTDSDHKVDGSRTTANVAPSFSSSATISVAENQTTVGTVVAADSDADDSVTGYAITGGADQTFFSIEATSGALTFDAPPNYEDADDSGTNNTYVVDVTATSGAGTRVMTATQTITVTVTDVDEDQSGTVTIDDTTPMVDDELTASTASVADPDGLPDPFAPTWKWYRTPDGGSETEITGETSATYTVLAADLGATLTAKASWTDNGGFANTLSSAPTSAVAAASALPTLSISDASELEGNVMRFDFTLSAAASEDVTVTWTASIESGDTASASDLPTTKAGIVTVTAGQTTGTLFLFTAAEDTIDEEDETFTMTLSGVSSNAQLAADPTAKGTIENDDDCSANNTTTCEVDVGGSATGAIDPVNDNDWFRVVLEANTRYQIDVEGADTGGGTLADPNVTLQDAMGSNVTVGTVSVGDNDSGVGKNSRTIYTPTANVTQYVRVYDTSFSGGTYTVSVIVLGANGNSEADADFPNNNTTTGRVEVGASATGNIESGTDVDRFKVDLEAGKTYQFDLEGAPTGRGTLEDPYLSLADLMGTVLEGDNDDGDGVNSQIVYTATETDTYYLRADKSATETGTYTLSVRDVTPPSDDNAAPVFSSSAARHVAENTTAVVTVTATDSDADDSVTGYEITGGADQGLFSIGATSGVLTFDAAPNYEDPKDSHNDNDYVVVVQATSGMGTREMTATQTITVTVTNMIGEAPGKPAKPKVSAASATSLRVSWSAPDNEGPPITDYDVQYRAGDSGDWSDANHSGTARATTLTGLTENTSYQVQVRATNAEGTGAWSDSGSGTPAEEDDLPADTSTEGVVEVNGSAVKGDIYKPVYVERTGGDDVDGWDFDTDWFAVELEADRIYRIDMKGQILSSPGLDISGVPVDPDLTLRLPEITAIYDADGNFLVNTFGPDESSAHHLFRVTFHVHDSGTHYIAASGESFEWGGYELTVIDITPDDGDGGDGGDGANVGKGLKNLRAVEEKGGVRLTWRSPDGAAVTGYRIERRRAGGQDSGPQRSHGQPGDHHTLVEDTGNTETSYVDESAEQGVEYEYRVTARNESGPGESSDWVRAGPEEEPVLGDALPGAPRNLTATPGNREVTLSWDPPDDNGNPPATRYRIEWRVDGKDYDRNDWGTSQETTYTTNAQANLANGVKYFFRVKAENDDGNSYGPYGPSSEEVSSTPTSGSAVDLGTPVLSDTETLHHGIVKLDWQDIEDAGWYVVQYYHVEDEEWLDLPAEGVDIAFHRSSAVVSNLHGLSWLRVGAASCDGASEWSQIEQLFGTNASDWDGVPVPEVAEGDEIEPCPVVLGTPVLSDTEILHHGMVQLDWQDIEDAGWYVVQYYHLEDEEWLDLPAEGVDIAFHGSSAVVSNLHGLSWLRVGAASCDGASEWSQIEESYGTNASDWKGVPVPEVAEGDETEPCPVVLGTPVLSDTEILHHGMVQLDWQDIEDAGWYVVQYYHLEDEEWLDLPAEGVDIAFHGSSAVVSNLHGLSWLRVGAASCDGASEWSQIEESYGTNASDWKGVPVPEVAEGDEIEPCSEDADTPENSLATGAPAISGTAQVGETLTANTSGVADADGLSNVQYEYQWLADDADISGATNATYTLVADDEGKAVTVQVSFTDDAGNEETLTSTATDAVSAAPVHAESAPDLEVGTPSVDDATLYTGNRFTLSVTVTNSGDGASEATRLRGYRSTDSTITTSDTEEGSQTVSALAAAGSSSFDHGLTAPSEAGTYYYGVCVDSVTDESDTTNNCSSSVTVTVSEPAPDLVVTGIAATDNIVTGGSFRVGVTVTNMGDAQSAATTLRWKKEVDGTTTEIGTSALSALTRLQGGFKTIRLTAPSTPGTSSYWACVDSVADESDATNNCSGRVTVTVTNNLATGAPTITGTAQVSQTLTASTSDISDSDGLDNVSYDYQWLADDSEIDGATSSTYTIQASDNGKVIKVQVTFTDDADNEETLTSAATGAVAGAQPTEPPAKPRNLSATATHDSVTLTWDDPGDDSITGYVILRRIPGVDPEGHFNVLVANTGTAATTYTDDTVSAETRYTYRIKAINGAGTSERSRWSHIDVPAAPAPEEEQAAEPPDKPTGLEATVTHGQVVLTWDDPGDDSITGYVILRRVRENDTGGDFSVLVADTGTAALTYTDDTVAAGLTYTYRIKAINEHGTSERSRWYHIDIPEAP